MQKFVRIYCEQLNANKLDNVDEMDKFLEAYNSSETRSGRIRESE